MEWLGITAMVLTMIYAAAIILAMRDRVRPPEPYVEKPIVVRSIWMAPIIVPLWAFALVMWFIVNGPVIAWRALSLVPIDIGRDDQTDPLPMRRFLRYLRIAFSATCLVACVLLIVLWVRSYDGVDGWYFECSSNRRVTFISLCGEIGAAYGHNMYYLGVSPNAKLEWDEHPENPYQQVSSSGYKYFTLRYSPYKARFRWNTVKGSWYAGAPYWCLTLVVATLGGVVWVRPSKRFSIRTLLIITAIVAVGLGLAVYEFRNDFFVLNR